MYFLYSLLLGLGVLLLLPRFLMDAVRHGKYTAGLSERAGGLPEFDAGGRPVIWLHCVSVGETQAARPLARAILEKFPGHALVVSTTTLTGQRVARETFGARAALVCYFPFDWAWSVRRALRRVNPSLVLMMETELWPRFLRECRRRDTPVAVVNGRLSEKSFRRYKIIKGFISRVLDDLSLALMQTEADAARMRALGLASERVRITGNVKFDMEETGESMPAAELRLRFGLGAGTPPLLLAASTHDAEERLVIESFKMLRAGGVTARLMIAPRHPERFDEVASLLDKSGLVWARRSAPPRDSDRACDAILLDSIGELRAVYPAAEMVFVGGSLTPVGGHNVLEPALTARCIVTGPHTFNFSQIVSSLLEHDALVQLPELDPAETVSLLGRTLRDLLADESKRRATGERARRVLESNRGATKATVEMLVPLVRSSEVKSASPPAAEGTRIMS